MSPQYGRTLRALIEPAIVMMPLNNTYHPIRTQ